jgi:DNA-binding LytR/AlgR family response regulator
LAQHYLLKKYAESTKKMNERILSSESQEVKTSKTAETIVISSESGKHRIKIYVKDLLFIKSTDNYVEVYTKKNGEIETNLIRSTLKRLEENLKAHPFLFKCHRAYLVNINNITRVTGNSQGYKLVFMDEKSHIPVSRNHSKKLFSLLS